MRTEAMNTALANSISLDRLEKYLRSQGDDLGLALSAYEMNLRLSEAF